MHSDALGTVQVHASLQNNVLGATLSAERPDVHHWLSAQLPLLEQTLSARQIQVGNLQMQAQTGSGAQGGSSQNPGQPPAQPRSFLPASAGQAAPAKSVGSDEGSAELLPTRNGGRHLNLRV